MAKSWRGFSAFWMTSDQSADANWDSRPVEIGFGDTTDKGTPRAAYFIRLRHDKGDRT